MVNKKLTTIFTILLVMNFLFSENFIMGNSLAIMELLFVLIYFIFTGSLKKTLFWHVVFMLSSLEISTDVANYSGVVYGYKHFELPFIPISLSTLFTIFLFLMSIFKNKTIKYKKNDNVYFTVIILFLLPFITGLIGILFRDYEIANFIERAMQPFLYLCVYILLVEYKNKQDINKLKELLISCLIGSVLASYISALVGVQASYGAHSTFPTNQILWFSPFLIILSIYMTGKQKIFIFTVGILACVNLIFFNATGKTILFVILAIVIYLYKNITNIKRFPYFFIILISTLLISVAIFDQIQNLIKSNILFQAKFEQLVGILNVKNWGYMFQNVPLSPRIRIIESINIFLTHKENLLDLIIGRGFGGYFEDKSNMLSSIDLSKGAFDKEQILTGHFTRPHESFNDIFLLTGFLGMILWSGLIIDQVKRMFRDKRESFYSLIGLIFILLFWNTYVILIYFGLITIYVSKYGEKNEN